MTNIIVRGILRKDSDPIMSKWWQSIDHVTLCLYAILLIIGLGMIWATSPKLADDNGVSASYYINRHFVFAGISLCIVLFISMLNVAFLRYCAMVAFVLGLFVLLLLPFYGEDYGMGSKRWLSIGFSVQPSEFIKPFYVVFCAWFIASDRRLEENIGKFVAFGSTVLLAGLLFIQPDYTQGVIVIFLLGFLFYINGISLRQNSLILGFFMMGIIIMAYHFGDHVWQRIDAYWFGEKDSFSQNAYAHKAIQMGGFFGVGLGMGRFKDNLPEAHTDFVVAVMAEELGLFWVAFLIAINFFIVVRMMLRMQNEHDFFLRFVCMGLATLFGVQTLIHFFVNAQLFPTTGMALPFISHGGSAILANSVLVGMMLAFGKKRFQSDIGEFM